MCSGYTGGHLEHHGLEQGEATIDGACGSGTALLLLMHAATLEKNYWRPSLWQELAHLLAPIKK